MLDLIAFLTLLVAKSDFVVPILQTNLGKIRGHYRVSSEGYQYDAYEGIPYAQPPIGNLRFRPPEPVNPWKGKLKANTLMPACIGLNRLPDANGNQITGVEDCLYLNVYVPKNSNGNLLPVLLWIYGGAFQYSTLNGNEQQYLIDRNIIFVSFNYRHGALGFMSTEDGVVTGNMGLKDQAMALIWVRENIEQFGGNPHYITLAGHSAGGASVHYHYLSPMSAGRFRLGMSFSGTAFHSWAQAKNSRSKALELARLLNCPTDSTFDMLECLQQRPVVDIMKAQQKFMHPYDMVPFGPVAEKYEKNAFIHAKPFDVIDNGEAYDAPWITGVVEDEGLYLVADYFINNQTALNELDYNWESLAPHILQFYDTIPKKDHANVARKIRNQYFGERPINLETSSILSKMITDRLFIVDSIKAAKMLAKHDHRKVRFFHYSYRAKNGLSNRLTDISKNFGASHGEDVALLFGNNEFDPKTNEKDFAMHNELMSLWLPIIIYGFPLREPKWTNVSNNSHELEFLQITGPNDVHMKTDSLGNYEFWQSIGIEENRFPKDQ